MKVFISYSWDSEDHKRWVQTLADRLDDCGAGFNVIYDRLGVDHQVDGSKFAAKGIYGADAVLSVVTASYARKASEQPEGFGGETATGAERHWTELDRYSRSRFLVVRRDADADAPNYLRASLHFDFTEDSLYEKSLAKLIQELRKISSVNAVLLDQRSMVNDKTKAITQDETYDFTRTEDLIAGFYTVRKPVFLQNQTKNWSMHRRIKYELWVVETPHPQLLLILFPSITIRHTLEDLAAKLRATPSFNEYRTLTVLRPDSPKPGYVEEQLRELGLNLQVTELTFQDYLSRFCVNPTSLRVTETYKEPFYIDQALYAVGRENDLGPAHKVLRDELLRENAPPLSLLVASGGAGKTTLLRWLAAEINDIGEPRVLLIEADVLRKLPREQFRRAHVSSLFELYQLHTAALASEHGFGPDAAGRPAAERSLFDLLLISGSVLILIDGIDELLSLMQGNFELQKFVDSINELNSQLGQTRVVLASREDAVTTTVEAVRKYGLPIYSLKGFTEREVLAYTKKRFVRRPREERDEIAERVLGNVKAISKAAGGISAILPFFVDVLCELEEEISGYSPIKIEGAVAERLADADYSHNDTIADLLVFAILERERERQGWAQSVGSLVEVFKELSSSHSGVATLETFSQDVDTFLSAGTPKAAEIFGKNPLIHIHERIVKYKYDFLNTYFLSLWLIEAVEKGSSGDLVIKHLSRFAKGHGSVLEDLQTFFRSRSREHVREKLSFIYGKLKDRACNSSDSSSESAMGACSALLHLAGLTVGRGLNRSQFSSTIFMIVGENVFSGRTRTSGLFIQGDYPVLHFIDRDVWSSGFLGYEAFTRCKFDNAKFYFCSFRSIHGENRAPTFSKSIFDLSSCELGELGTLFSGSSGEQESLLSVEEIKKFFRFFFIGGGFVDKDPRDLYKFSRPGITDEFIEKLIAEGILVQGHFKGKLMYSVSPEFTRQVQKFVNENNQSKRLRLAFAPFTQSR